MSRSTNFMESPVALNFEDPTIYHDRVLVVGEKKFHVVSGVLSLWSEHFRGLFGGNFNEANMKEIELKEVNADVFEIFLRLIHHSHLVILKADDIIPLIEMSYRFLTPIVLNLCKIYIDKNLCIHDDMPLQLLKTACNYGNESLKKTLTTHLKDVIMLRKYNCIEILKIAHEHKLDELKKSTALNMADHFTVQKCCEYLDCCAKFNLEELKSTITGKIEDWKFDTIPENLIIELSKSAFKHDNPVLKAKIRYSIYHMADQISSGCTYRGKNNTTVSAGFSANWYLKEYQKEIFALPAEISQFIAISVCQWEL